jgi:hypothetical protein
VTARVVSIVAIMGKADTSTAIGSITSVDALLKCGNVVFLDDVVALVVHSARDLVVLASSIVKGASVDRRA